MNELIEALTNFLRCPTINYNARMIDDERIAELEEEVASLSNALNTLRNEYANVVTENIRMHDLCRRYNIDIH